MVKKKPKTGRIEVKCKYDNARVIKVTGFMAPVEGHPGRWIIQVDTLDDKRYPPDEEPEG